MGRELYTLDEVAESLKISKSQLRALLRRGEIESTETGDGGQCHIEDNRLEEFIERLYYEQRSKRSLQEIRTLSQATE